MTPDTATPDDFRQLVDSLPLRVALIGADGTFRYVNRDFAAAAGLPPSRIVGRAVAAVLGEAGAGALRAPIERALDGETVTVDGPPRRVLAPHPHPPGPGGRAGACSLIEGAPAGSRTEEEWTALAHHDPVTGLPNRAWLLRAIDEGRTRPLVLIVVDIDRLTGMRNSFGHAFTDELMIGLAARLATGLAPGDHLARIGNDALAVLAPGARDDPAVTRRLDAIADTLRTVTMPSGASIFLSASVGAAAGLTPREAPEDLLRDAEIATSRAREGGGSRCLWFDPSMRARLIDQVRTEHDLRAALHGEDEVWVAYQPIVELISGRLAGFEALMRWNHPERGAIPPGHFIPIAEQTGLVVLLGRWVLGEACRQLARWQAERARGLPELFMSVNLSPRQLEEPGFADTLRAVLAETGIDPGWLKLEITESAMMRRPEDSIVMLRELKSIGVQLSIDDFGTGYSSLSYLHKYPVDSLKIDRSFVSALAHSDENRSIVRIIVDLARLLGFDVVAEGIETEEDANLLRALACDYGRGYLYAKPQPPERVGPMLEARPPWLKPPGSQGS